MVFLNSNTPVNTAPQASGTLHISSTQILPQVLPVLSLGDVLQFTVRSKNPQGQGQLYYRGQLINAALPENVQAGDRLVARIEQQGEQLLLRILELKSAAATQPTTAVSSLRSTPLGASLDQALAKIVSALPQESQSFSLEALTRAGADFHSQAEALLSALEQPILANPAELRGFLTQVLNGGVGAGLRELAEQIRAYVGADLSASPFSKFALPLRTELATLLSALPGKDADFIQRSLQKLFHAVSDELQRGTKHSAEERATLQRMQTGLAAAMRYPEQIPSRLEQLIGELSQFPGAAALPAGLDPHSAMELDRLAVRLDQLAGAYDALNQLNPLLQAFGEPAMILFPFLFQGMLHHAELLVDPDASQKKRQGGQGGEEEERSEQLSGEGGYQRIRLFVPLPTLGEVHLEIAYRDQELLARALAEDEAKARFIAEQLPELTRVLSQLGFSLKEFSSAAAPSARKILEQRIGMETILVA